MTVNAVDVKIKCIISKTLRTCLYFYCDASEVKYLSKGLVDVVALIKPHQDEAAQLTKLLDCLGRGRIHILYISQYCCNAKLKTYSGAPDLCVSLI